MRPPTALPTLFSVVEELERQHLLWGDQEHPDGTGAEFELDARIAKDVCTSKVRAGTVTWRDILLEEVYEALAETDADDLAGELDQVAAVAVQWAETIRRRTP